MTIVHKWVKLMAIAWLGLPILLAAQEPIKRAAPANKTVTRAFETPASLQQYVLTYLKNHPGVAPESRFEVILGEVSPDHPTCSDLSTYLPANPLKVTGNVRVALRCQAPTPWLTFATAKILTLQKYWVWRDDLNSGSVLTGQELTERLAWSDQLPQGAITDLNFFTGKTLKQNASKEAVATANMVKAEPVISSGQAVKIIVSGNGFKISSDGRALSSALPGQSIQVRMSTGQVVSGVATANGSVEIMRP